MVKFEEAPATGAEAGAAGAAEGEGEVEQIILSDVDEDELCASQLELLATNLQRSTIEDDLLPSIGARGEERREHLRKQAAAAAAHAARLAGFVPLWAAHAHRAQETLADAYTALVKPEKPEEEDMGGLEESDEEWPPQELVAAADKAKAEATEATASFQRVEAASARATKASNDINGVLAAVEGEVKKRVDAAARVAGYWAQAREEEISCAVIWLHGQGESEASWQTKLASVRLPESAGVCRWIWPRAELQHCSTRGNVLTPQWFDTPEFPVCRVIRGVPDRKRVEEDPLELAKATSRVHAAIEALEAEGLPSERIALAGFGQGAALVVHAVLRCQRQLAGGAVLSGWVPCFEALKTAATRAAPPEGRPAPLDFLWCHGARDGVVEPGLAAESAKRLQEEFGIRMKFRMFPELAFGVDDEVIDTLQTWLAERLGGFLPEKEERAN